MFWIFISANSFSDQFYDMFSTTEPEKITIANSEIKLKSPMKKLLKAWITS